MGGNRMTDTAKRSETASVRLTYEMRTAMKNAADAAGLTVPAWCRMAYREKLARTPSELRQPPPPRAEPELTAPERRVIQRHGLSP